MKNDQCKGLSFNDCELAILRSAVDKAEQKQASKVVNSDEIKKMIHIVETFIKNKKLICYGGTAINNILPKYDQFYDKDLEIPDYDFFSYNALEDAKELTDIYDKEGYHEVEGKSGQHYGTYKVFVNFIPIADITYIPKELFMALKTDAIKIAGILYAPANYLRMGMYLELSRPDGDVSRWEKVLKRLTLLNKHYPIKSYNCEESIFQREMEHSDQSDKIYNIVTHTLIDQGVVFFGGYALSIYSNYMPKHHRHHITKIPDFDVLIETPEVTAEIVKERLEENGIKNVKIVKHPAFGEIISECYEVLIKNKDIHDTIVFIYKPIACHNYNIIKHKGNVIKIATIETMLSFYLAFLYANRKYFNKERILCMSTYLFEVQQKNRLEQKGVLRRFTTNCIGHQETIEEMRAEKSEKFKELKAKRSSTEFQEWFLRYRPGDKYDESNKTKTKAKSIIKKSSSDNKTLKTNKTTKTTKSNEKKSKTKKILDYFKL